MFTIPGVHIHAVITLLCADRASPASWHFYVCFHTMMFAPKRDADDVGGFWADFA